MALPEIIDSNANYCACKEIPVLGLSAEQRVLRGCGAAALFGPII